MASVGTTASEPVYHLQNADKTLGGSPASPCAFFHVPLDDHDMDAPTSTSRVLVVFLGHLAAMADNF
jgi:hypothetical protein